jgi:hypothetical protein
MVELPSALPLSPAGPDTLLRVLDPRPPGPLASTWSRLPCTKILVGSCRQSKLASPVTALQLARHAGWIASMTLAAASIAVHGAWAPYVSPTMAALLHALAMACTLVAACTLPTDACGIGAAAAPDGCSLRLFCGNLGLLLATMTGASQAGIDAMDVLERQVCGGRGGSCLL